jgi:hypothetical protein
MMSNLQASLVSYLQTEQDPFQHVMAVLLDMQQQLEATRQRQCNEKILDLLLGDLQSTAREVRQMPLAPGSWTKAVQGKLLKHIRNASVELLLALDQVVAYGRTYRFYQHLAICQEHLARWQAPALFMSVRTPLNSLLVISTQIYNAAALLSLWREQHWHTNSRSWQISMEYRPIATEPCSLLLLL